MLCARCLLFLYSHFKFKELQFKKIINRSCKCVVIIIPQLEKKYVSYKSLLDDNLYHTRDIKNFGTYVSVKYSKNKKIL